MMPALVVAAVYLPAFVQVGIASATGMVAFIRYANYLEFTSILVALFAASQSPELVVTDRQQGVLSAVPVTTTARVRLCDGEGRRDDDCATHDHTGSAAHPLFG